MYPRELCNLSKSINIYILLGVPFLALFGFEGRKSIILDVMFIWSLVIGWMWRPQTLFSWQFSNWPFSWQVPKGKVVVLNFRFIDLESDNLCRYDFVDVYNGHGNGQRIGRFCGTFRPGALVSSGNKMMVQMISDANTAGNGFMAMFSAAEPNERGIDSTSWE